MSILAPEQPRATGVDVIDGELELDDGRSVRVPLEWFPKLRDAAPEDLAEWRLVGRGVGIYWPKLDEDISVRASDPGVAHREGASPFPRAPQPRQP